MTFNELIERVDKISDDLGVTREHWTSVEIHSPMDCQYDSLSVIEANPESRTLTLRGPE